MLRHHTGKKPVYAQEVLWPGNTHNVDYSNDTMRKKAYVLLVSAVSINFADMAGESSTGFGGSLDLNDTVFKRHQIIKQVWDFFETQPYYRMTPSQELVDNGFCLADPGHDYLVYLPDGGSVKVKTDEGRYNVRWINASDTSDIREHATISGDKQLEAPNKGADWLLRLTRLKN